MQENINEEFGNILHKYRNARHMSQEQFAELCDISFAYYGRLERGEHSVTLDTCKKIADALNVPIYELFQDIP